MKFDDVEMFDDADELFGDEGSVATSTETADDDFDFGGDGGFGSGESFGDGDGGFGDTGFGESNDLGDVPDFDDADFGDNSDFGDADFGGQDDMTGESGEAAEDSDFNFEDSEVPNDDNRGDDDFDFGGSTEDNESADADNDDFDFSSVDAPTEDESTEEENVSQSDIDDFLGDFDGEAAENKSNDDFGEVNDDLMAGDEEDDGEIGEISKSELSRSNDDFNIDDMYVNKADAGIAHQIKVDKDAFEFKHIEVKKITVTANRIRKNYSLDKLKLSIQNEGLLNPIVVAPTKTEGIYVVVKGLRRLLACAAVGLSEVPCIINNKVSATEIPIVEALYTHSKPYTIQEMLDYIDYLKNEKGIASATYIEHLLNMESGDYNKLMDIMEDGDEDITGQLLGGQMNIQQAFKKLEQKRKKMSKEEKDTARATKIYDNSEEYGADKVQGSGETSDDSDGSLSSEDVGELLATFDNESLDTEDGEALRKEGDNIKGYQPHKQDPNNRERLDPKLRKAILARDNNTCKICEQISGQEYTEVLDVHHIHEVYLGGKDEETNLITACTCCHKLVHLWARGELHVRPFEQMDKDEARKFKRVIKLGNVVRHDMVSKGMSKKELKEKDQADTIGRRLKGSSDQVAG